MPRRSPDRSDHPAAYHRYSPLRPNSSRKDRSPTARHRSSRRSISPARKSPPYKAATRSSPTSEKHHSSRSLSAKHSYASVKSPPLRSPSPRTKRLKRAQVEKDGKSVPRGSEETNGSGKDRERASRHKGKDSETEVVRQRVEKRPGRDEIEVEGAKSRREWPVSPADHRRRDRHLSGSPPRAARNGAHDEERNSTRTEPHQDDDSMSKMQAAEEALEMKQKQKPSFELSGKLAAETNRVRGITLLFNEPSDAQKPDVRWRLYVFKAGDVLNEPLYIHRQSCYLFGRERRVADIPTDHPSCSKQHAVIQFRQIEKEQPDGMLSKQVKPYVMDLGSTNKTFLNDIPIEAQRYYELFEKDTLKFGNSSREYVLLHENSAA